MSVFKEDLERAQERVEAWWQGRVLERAVILLKASREDARPYAGPDTHHLHRYFADPEFVYPRLSHELESRFYGGEAMPPVFAVRSPWWPSSASTWAPATGTSTSIQTGRFPSSRTGTLDLGS